MRNKNILYPFITFSFLLLVTILLPPSLTFAAENKLLPTGFESICSKEAGLAVCVQQIYLLSLGLGAIVALLMIVLAGYRYMAAGGNAQQVEGAKEAFASAFIGLIILFVGFILLYIVNPDLVRFRKLGFAPVSAPLSPSRVRVNATPADAGLRFVAAFALPNATVDSKTGTVTQVLADGKELVFTPSADITAARLLESELRRNNLDTSGLVFEQYEVNDPSLMPGSMVSILGGRRPSEIVVVLGSLFLFDANELVGDVSGEEVYKATSQIALSHFGVNLAVATGDADTGTPSQPAPGEEEQFLEPLPNKFRYLKILANRDMVVAWNGALGWVSWREIEIYDAENRKLIPVNARADNNTAKEVKPAANAYDGDPNTYWSSGDHCAYGPCTNVWDKDENGEVQVTFVSQGWIVLDYGAVHNVSKIRLLHYGNSTIENVFLMVSNDDKDYITVRQASASMTSPLSDGQWLEFSTTPKTAPPSVSLFVGPGPVLSPENPNPPLANPTAKSATVGYIQQAVFKWSSRNVDYVTSTVQWDGQKSCGDYNLRPTDIYNKNFYIGRTGLIVARDPFPQVGTTLNGRRLGGSASSCEAGLKLTVTFKGIQVATGKTAQDTVVVNIGTIAVIGARYTPLPPARNPCTVRNGCEDSSGDSVEPIGAEGTTNTYCPTGSHSVSEIICPPGSTMAICEEKFGEMQRDCLADEPGSRFELPDGTVYCNYGGLDTESQSEAVHCGMPSSGTYCLPCGDPLCHPPGCVNP